MDRAQLLAKYMAEFEEIQKQRKLLGLDPLTAEEAAQLGRRMGQADAIQSAHSRAEARLFPLRLAVLILLVSLGLFLIGLIVFK